MGPVYKKEDPNEQVDCKQHYLHLAIITSIPSAPHYCKCSVIITSHNVLLAFAFIKAIY